MENTNFIWQILAHHSIGSLLFILLGFFLSRLLKRNDIADVLWGLGFFLISSINYSQLPLPTFRSNLVMILITLWSLRLSIYLGIRNLSKSEEDPRYQAWRHEWGRSEPTKAFLKIFCLQGLFLFIISLPLGWALNSTHSELGLIEIAGAILISFGLIFEFVADYELYIFKKQNKGKILNQGTWALSRHPNYFGEILVWWGFFLIALPTPLGSMTLISPLTITFLLLNISGIPMLEKILAQKGQDFLNYQKTTSAILPFAKRQIYTFASIAITLIILDTIWLGLIMGDFYRSKLLDIARISNGKWDPMVGAAALVYFFLALALSFFTVSESKLQSFFKGSILGLCIYGVYDLTNLALIRSWNMELSIVDLLWGSLLCGTASTMGSLLRPQNLKPG